jgi:hypothetical protein
MPAALGITTITRILAEVGAGLHGYEFITSPNTI